MGCDCVICIELEPAPPRNALKKSIGKGKIIVEFFSADIELND